CWIMMGKKKAFSRNLMNLLIGLSWDERGVYKELPYHQIEPFCISVSEKRDPLTSRKAFTFGTLLPL
ncbi:MAG: hypothetical protein NZ781_11245, partial [Armatimonadetes bacterium]|nr:hypothetical protein [Armatimonadota bacterium]